MTDVQQLVLFRMSLNCIWCGRFQSSLTSYIHYNIYVMPSNSARNNSSKGLSVLHAHCFKLFKLLTERQTNKTYESKAIIANTKQMNIHLFHKKFFNIHSCDPTRAKLIMLLVVARRKSVQLFNCYNS